MTLIVSLPAKDGIVMGSDSQLTLGQIRTRMTKIHRLNRWALWGGSGEVAVLQRVAERIDAMEGRDRPLLEIRDTLSRFVRESIETLIDLDFRGQWAKDADAALQLHPCDLIFVEFRDRVHRTLHVTAPGVNEWVEGKACTGNQSALAHALLGKYGGMQLRLHEAKILLYKTIEEAIDVGACGAGLPIHIWQVSGIGVREASWREIHRLSKAVSLIRRSELELVTRHHLAA